MLRIAICDDERSMVSSIHKMVIQSVHINDGGVICEGGIEVDEFIDGSSLLESMQDASFYDLIFLDIEMQDLDGITLAHRIRQQDEQVLLVYVSSHEKYMIDLFEVSPFRFVRKPIEEEIFQKILGDAIKKILGRQHYFIYESGWSEYRALIKEIYFFESNGRRIFIVSERGKENFYGKLDEIEEKLSQMDKYFLRIHQSFLVNPEKVIKINTGEMLLSNGMRLPISKKRQKEINMQYLKQYRE